MFSAIEIALHSLQLEPPKVSPLVFQAEDGIRDVERSRGLGDVHKRQVQEYDVITC